MISTSTEDTLAGSSQVDAFVRELVKIPSGTGDAADDDGDDDDDSHEPDEDAQLTAVLALSGGGQYQAPTILRPKSSQLVA